MNDEDKRKIEGAAKAVVDKLANEAAEKLGGGEKPKARGQQRRTVTRLSIEPAASSEGASGVSGPRTPAAAPPPAKVRDDLREARWAVLDQLEDGGWIVRSSHDARAFQAGFERLVRTHFAKRGD